MSADCECCCGRRAYEAGRVMGYAEAREALEPLAEVVYGSVYGWTSLPVLAKAAAELIEPIR